MTYKKPTVIWYRWNGKWNTDFPDDKTTWFDKVCTAHAVQTWSHFVWIWSLCIILYSVSYFIIIVSDVLYVIITYCISTRIFYVKFHVRILQYNKLNIRATINAQLFWPCGISICFRALNSNCLIIYKTVLFLWRDSLTCYNREDCHL